MNTISTFALFQRASRWAPAGRQLDGTAEAAGLPDPSAAKRLFMHRNILDYRIARIEEMLGCNLASLMESECERMILSCTILLERFPTTAKP